MYGKQNNILIIKNIKKAFDDSLIIDNISMNVRASEFVSILGLSGSGKSTILNIVSGLSSPDSGSITYDNIEITGVTGKLGYMPQKDLLLPWKTIIDNVCIPLIIKGFAKVAAASKAIEYFELFGLSGYEKKHPHELSGGMRQRAALLRTFLFSGNLMLLDEPFGSLDAITKTKMQDWLATTQKELHTSILFVTHDIDEAIFLSDRIYVISDKPSVINGEFSIDIQRDSNRNSIASEKFLSLKNKIYKSLIVRNV